MVEVQRYLTGLAGPLLALGAIVAPFQSLVQLPLPYLLTTTFVAGLFTTAVVARRLANWGHVLPIDPGPRADERTRANNWAWPLTALGIVCVGFVLIAWWQVNLVALRIAVVDGPRPVAIFTAPLRPVAHMQINPPGADFSTCKASDLTPRGSREIAIERQDWIPGKAIAALVITDFAAPQILQLDCGPIDAYLPPILGPSDLVVLVGVQLLWAQLAIVVVGCSLWLGAVFRWRSLRQ